jgi:hypothetical protein
MTPKRAISQPGPLKKLIDVTETILRDEFGTIDFNATTESSEHISEPEFNQQFDRMLGYLPKLMDTLPDIEPHLSNDIKQLNLRDAIQEILEQLQQMK